MNKTDRLAWLPQRVLDDMAASCPPGPYDGREDLVRAYQSANGLNNDGHPGVNTAQALYGSRRAIPRNRHAVERQTGDHPWVRTGRGRGVRWVDGRARPKIGRATLHTGKTVRIQAGLEKEVERLFELACDVSGYTPVSVVGYVSRVIGGTDKLSMHAYGIAIDFDPRSNPWGGVQKSGEPSLMRQFPLFYEVWEWAGWEWGGRWRNGKGDDMHAERKG